MKAPKMNYFSRLTDIVTCNLGEILSRESNPVAAIKKIIGEMEEGLAGARRSVATSAENEKRLERERAELEGQVARLIDEARDALKAADESAARIALIRKQEVADVIAGLEQQHRAARATREHLTTTLRALEARLSEARRKEEELASDTKVKGGVAKPGQSGGLQDDPRVRQVEDELAALKRELDRA